MKKNKQRKTSSLPLQSRGKKERLQLHQKERASQTNKADKALNKSYFLDQKGLKKAARILRKELDRTMREIRIKSAPRLYYLSYLFRNVRKRRIWGRLGAIHDEQDFVTNTVYCDARVGSYQYDNLMDGGLYEEKENKESGDYVRVPLEIDSDAMSFQLWKLTDACYREAAENYFKKKSKGLHFQQLYPKLPSNRKVKPVKDFPYKKPEDVDLEFWKELVRKASKKIKKHTFITNSWFEFSASQIQKLFLDSSGSEVFGCENVFELRCYIWALNEKGEGVSYEINHIEGTLKGLPDPQTFYKEVDRAIRILKTKVKSLRLNSYSGPVLLSAQAAGTFFHEVIGHRLEGSRLLSKDEGGTFKNMRGKAILPDYLDVVDDPLTHSYGPRALTGHFRYDDEGSPAQRAVLVKKGKLVSFLSGRTPLPGQTKNNGHARNQSSERPISRMGNLFVINHKPVSQADMFSRFLEEIRKQKKEYGIYVEEVIGGETGTGSYDFQAFKGEILLAYRVFADGSREMIRGVDFVGTPLSALDSVLCMGDDAVAENSFCGAESGIIPVSTICPSMLLSNLELQSKEQSRYTEYILPLPYE